MVTNPWKGEHAVPPVPHAYRHLQLDVDDGIAVVTLMNPPSNALSELMLRDIQEAMDVLDDERIHAVVVTGFGQVFSVGADLARLFTASTDEVSELARRGRLLIDRLEGLRKPVIAAINGHCLGGGLELALACHVRVASSSAKLGLPEIRLGLIPGLGGTLRLPLVVGKSNALDLMLTGRTVRAAEALRLGLVNAVTAPAALLEETRRLARRIGLQSPAAVAAVMRCVTLGAATATMLGRSLERETFTALHAGMAMHGDAGRRA